MRCSTCKSSESTSTKRQLLNILEDDRALQRDSCAADAELGGRARKRSSQAKAAGETTNKRSSSSSSSTTWAKVREQRSDGARAVEGGLPAELQCELGRGDHSCGRPFRSRSPLLGWKHPGPGNMKLALNGGADNRPRWTGLMSRFVRRVGTDNIFIFGLSADEGDKSAVAPAIERNARRSQRPRNLAEVLRYDRLGCLLFRRREIDFRDLLDALTNHDDLYGDCRF